MNNRSERDHELKQSQRQEHENMSRQEHGYKSEQAHEHMYGEKDEHDQIYGEKDERDQKYEQKEDHDQTYQHGYEHVQELESGNESQHDSSLKGNKAQSAAGATDNRQENKEPSLDPFEINFLPEFEHSRGPREAFVNQHGVVIGDHEYDSPNSPLNQWSIDTDPHIMAEEEWVHPFKDIGFHTAENIDYFENGIAPDDQSQFMHADKDVAYPYNRRDLAEIDDPE